jgi:hypothetical protein
MSDEDISRIDKQIKKESELGVGGPTMPPQPEQPQQEQVDPEQYPPEDNTVDDKSQESDTPDLDAEVEKYTSLLNKGKGK